jgi:tetratricopeptide (TPR) repeat protein
MRPHSPSGRTWNPITSVTWWCLHRKPPERAPEAARNYLRILLEKDPDNDLGIAESYKFLGERLLAEAHYWQALEHPNLNDPTRYLCLYNVARLNLEHAIEEPQRLSLAYKQAAIGVVLAPHRAECLVIQGQAAEAMGELAEAKRCYTEALSKEMPHDDVGLVYHEYYEKIPRLLLAALEKRSLCEL